MQACYVICPIGELGKIYASVGLLTTVVGMLSTMAYRQVCELRQFLFKRFLNKELF